ncbi:MAG: HNH endonuclease [Candidatus Pacebacteria bacterium]|nr:HNH endonuclease [Candidatus Paceibacterota bacterium]
MRTCVFCKKELVTRHQKKFCSSKCQQNLRHKNYIYKWKKNKIDGNRGIVTRTTSPHLKRYLVDKHGEKCSKCGWNKRNSITGRVPIELDHIDGNGENNKENNLRLLCPNCHSLTPHFRNLNRGNGRKWRKDKYIKHK